MNPTEQYARAVVDGTLVAGPHVRATCQRHLDDLAQSERGEIPYRFDEEKPRRVYRYFEEVLRLPAPGGSSKLSVPFKLTDWQRFIVGSLFGWVRPDGLRRYRKAFIMTGKGGGKTHFAAGLGLYMTTSDGEPRAENFCIARDADQALLTLKAAADIYDLSPKLQPQLYVRGGRDRPEQLSTSIATKKNNFFRRVASEREGKGHSGAIPHFVVIDEFHEHDTDAMLKFYDLGTKNRRQPLIFIITNAGASVLSPCGEECEYAQDVASGAVEDESYFSYVCALDEEDEITDPSCWPKVMPSLPDLPGMDYVTKQLAQAKGMPSQRSLVERLLFCKWGMGNEAPFFTLDTWKEVETREPFDEGELREAPLFIAIDLGWVRDLSAAACVWKVSDTRFLSRSKAWTHSDDLEVRFRQDRMPIQWTEGEDACIEVVPGNAMDYRYIAQWLIDMMHQYPNLKGVACDRWRMKFLKDALDEAGVRWVDQPRLKRHSDLLIVDHGQGWHIPDFEKKRKNREIPLGMPISIAALEERVLAKELLVEFNPLLRWAVQAAIPIFDPGGNRKFDKRRQSEKIDPAVAQTMSIGFAVEGTPPEPRPFRAGRILAGA